MQGHIFKIKVNEEWVPIPVLYTDIYNAYVAYCRANDISNPVSEDVYYATIGELGNIKNELDVLLGDTSKLTELSNKLEEGVLPLSMGGTGEDLSDYESFANFLTDYLASNTDVGAVIDNKIDNNDTITDMQSSISSMLSNSVIAYGDKSPNDVDASQIPNCTYYFQYEV
jgi:hypothetical protein